jgi:hypothetical protein
MVHGEGVDDVDKVIPSAGLASHSLLDNNNNKFHDLLIAIAKYQYQ